VILVEKVIFGPEVPAAAVWPKSLRSISVKIGEKLDHYLTA
jgi:hypothetical protein